MVAVRAGIYARVSTKQQAEKEVSLERQLAECRDLALRLGAEEVVEYVDRGASGADPNRPALQALLRDVREGSLDLVVCWDIDRWARDLGDQLVFAEEVERHGCRLEFVTTKTGTTPEDVLFFQMKGAIAQYERAKIRQRCRIGRAGKLQKGKLIPGRVTYGYRYNHDPDNPAYEVYEPEAEVVRSVFRWTVEEGLGALAIAHRLYAMGVPSPAGTAAWNATCIKYMLKNPAYKGQFCNQRFAVQYTAERKRRMVPRPPEEWVVIPVPAIVSEEMWQAAQSAVVSRQIGKRGGPDSEAPHLLIGLIWCGTCGYRLNATYGTNNSKAPYYTCQRRHHPDPSRRCPSRGQLRAADGPRARGVDGVVWGMVERWLRDPDLLLEEYERRRRVLEDESLRVQLREALDRAQAKLEALLRQKDELLDLRLEGLLDESELRARMLKLEKRRQVLVAEVEKCRRDLGAIGPGHLDPGFEEFCATVRERLGSLTLADRRQALRYLGVRVVVKWGPPKEVVVSVPLPLLAEGEPTWFEVTRELVLDRRS